MYKHILVSTDGSELSQRALSHAVAVAIAFNAKLSVITVREPLRAFMTEGVTITVSDEEKLVYEREVDRRLDAARAEAAEAGIEIDTRQVEDPEPWRAIIDAADAAGVDLIVMASHGRRGISALLLGSETHKLLTHCSIPVLVVR